MDGTNGSLGLSRSSLSRCCCSASSCSLISLSLDDDKGWCEQKPCINAHDRQRESGTIHMREFILSITFYCLRGTWFEPRASTGLLQSCWVRGWAAMLLHTHYHWHLSLKLVVKPEHCFQNCWYWIMTPRPVCLVPLALVALAAPFLVAPSLVAASQAPLAAEVILVLETMNGYGIDKYGKVNEKCSSC